MGNESESILLVDDNETFVWRMAKGFKKRGFEVYTANGYETAMTILKKERPANAVFDLKMDGKSGLDLLSDALQLDPDLRVVVLTGYGSIATATDAIRAGAVSYLAKPANIDDILLSLTTNYQVTTGEDRFQPQTLQRVEWEHIQRVLNDCNNNISLTAKKLNIHRRTLQRKLNYYAPSENA